MPHGSDESSTFLHHIPCTACGSSDASSLYSDGHTYCFKCGVTGRGEEQETPTRPKMAGDLLPAGDYGDIEPRKLRVETCRKFGYTVGEYKGKPCHIAPYRTRDGAEICAQKVRSAGKKFTIRGDISKAGLFGQHLWAPGGKRLVITEGEIDALSYAQATNLSWPVVSVKNGASSAAKEIAAEIEFVDSFEEVVFLMDNDEPGRKAAVACAELLTPGRAKIAELPLKDANEMLKAGRSGDMTKAVYQAREHRPDGIINGRDLWEQIRKPVTMGLPYPWPSLNEPLYGLRAGEIVTFTAGSGVGKSAVVAEIAYHLAQNLGRKVGYVALEESVGRSGLRFMGLAADKPLHLPSKEPMTSEQLRPYFEQTLGTGKYELYDHWGSLESDNLMSRLRYMAIGCGCEFLVLDHLSIVVSGAELSTDERRMIDHTMTALRTFTEATKCGLLLVSHLKRPEGRGHEQGGQTSLSQLRGSQAIAQLSDIVIGLERNQQAEDPEERDNTTFRILKNRYSGITGEAGAVRYIRETGRLIAVAGFADESNSSEDF